MFPQRGNTPRWGSRRRPLIGEPPAPWRIIAERKIVEWIEAGGPQKLTNLGQPLDLSENPFTPHELRMAFHVLKNADAAPVWIMIGQEIEAKRARGASAKELNELIRRFNAMCPVTHLHRQEIREA